MIYAIYEYLILFEEFVIRFLNNSTNFRGHLLLRGLRKAWLRRSRKDFLAFPIINGRLFTRTPFLDILTQDVDLIFLAIVIDLSLFSLFLFLGGDLNIAGGHCSMNERLCRGFCYLRRGLRRCPHCCLGGGLRRGLHGVLRASGLNKYMDIIE